MNVRLFLILIFSLLLGTSCSQSQSPKNVDDISSYKAGMSMGENGVLYINFSSSNKSTFLNSLGSTLTLEPLSYEVIISDSSYGLLGQTFTGSILENSDGSYSTSDGNQIFSYPNYSILMIKVSKSVAPQYFSVNTHLNQASDSFVYIPVVGLLQSSLISSTNDPSFNFSAVNDLEMREVSMTAFASGGNTSYSAEGSRGSMHIISTNSFSVSLCSNNGASVNNTNLSSCPNSNPVTITYTYNPTTGSWQRPASVLYPSQIINAYFVPDQNNQVFGYEDISDSTGSSAGFRYIQISSASTQLPSFSSSNVSYTSYSTCTSSSNCETGGNGVGVYSGSFSTSSITTQISTYQADGPCYYSENPNNPTNGFMSEIMTPDTLDGGICTQPGDGGDNILIGFGGTTQNGKTVMMLAAAGYDQTVIVGPSQKLGISRLVFN